MFRRFRMNGADISTGLDKNRNQTIHGLDHQMDVDRRRCQRTDRRANQWTDGHVRHVMIVHHVEMNPVGTGGDDIGDFGTKTGEISRENAGRKQVPGEFSGKRYGILPYAPGNRRRAACHLSAKRRLARCRSGSARDTAARSADRPFAARTPRTSRDRRAHCG